MQMAARAEADRFKKIIRESIYPALQKAGSIIDAKQVCEILKTVIMTKCNAHWADKTVLDLDLLQELTTDTEVKDRDMHIELITALNELTITDAQKLLQGMGGALDGYSQRVAAKQPLSEVPVEEIIMA